MRGYLRAASVPRASERNGRTNVGQGGSCRQTGIALQIPWKGSPVFELNGSQRRGRTQKRRMAPNWSRGRVASSCAESGISGLKTRWMRRGVLRALGPSGSAPQGSNKRVESRAIERKLIRSSWSAFKNSFFFAHFFFSRVCACVPDTTRFRSTNGGWFSRSSGERFVKSKLGLVSIMLTLYAPTGSLVEEIFIFARSFLLVRVRRRHRANW